MRVRRALYTILFVGVLAGGVVAANQNLGSAAIVVSLGLAVSVSFGATAQNALAAIQLRQEPYVNRGTRVTLAGPSGPFTGEVRWMGWRVSRIQAADGSEIIVPNVMLTSGMILLPKEEKCPQTSSESARSQPFSASPK